MKGKISFGGMTGIVILAVMVACSLAAPVLAPYDPNEINMAQGLQGFSRAHLFGTDLLGRDMFSRILYGGKNSMILALAATLFTMCLGLFAGVAGGYFGGWWDAAITAVTNMFQGLPGTSLMIAIAGIMGPSFQSLMLALVLTGWTGFARVARTEAMRLNGENYIDGIRCMGGGSFYIIWKHLIPNIAGNIMILFTTRIGRSVLSLSALSYLGLGIQPPNPDWSVMISDARMNFRSAPHLILIPGLCIVLLVMSINLTGDLLRDYFDVKNAEVKEF